MSNGFERRKEQSKEEIRRAAWELFAQFGVERVSMADIARKAGVSQATIYNNFASKEALAQEFRTTVVDRLVEQAEQVLVVDKPFAEKIAAFVGFIETMIAHGTPPGGTTTVFTSSADLQSDPDIRKIRDTARERMTALLLGLCAEGKAQGQVDAGLSEEAVSLYFRAFMDVFIDPQLQRRFAANPALVREVSLLLVRGLAGRPLPDGLGPS